MVTNPQSKCHKWKTPSQSVCTAQLAYYTPGSTSKPASPAGGPSTECKDDLDDVDVTQTSASGAFYQFIFSLGAKTKATFRADATFMAHVVQAIKAYVDPADNSTPFITADPRLQIKALDNSAAGVGLHVRLFFDSSAKGLCQNFADDNWSQGLATDAATEAAENYLYDNIFAPYQTAQSLGNTYFGTVTRRATMQFCKDFKKSTMVGVSSGILKGDVGYVSDMSNI